MRKLDQKVCGKVESKQNQITEYVKLKYLQNTVIGV